MTLLTDLGKASAKGSLNLFFGIVISNVILAVGAIVMARLLGSAFYGLYTLSSVPAAFFGLFIGFGVRNAMVRYLAQFNHHNETERVKTIVASGLIFVAISSSIFVLFSFVLSGWLAEVFARPYAKSLIELYSLTIITDALTVAAQSVFVGLEKTQYYCIILIFQAILKTVISTSLIVIGLGTLGAVAGYAVASLGTSVFGTLIIYFFIIRRLHLNFTELNLLSNLRMLISYGFPLFVRNLVDTGFRMHFLNFLMVIYASNILIGNYQVALNFQVLVSFFAIPIATVLFPAFSKLNFESDHKVLKTIFAYSVKYTSLIVVPATTVLIVLSEQIVSTVYGQSYTLTPLYLSLSALSFVYAAFGQYSISAFLNSQGETRKTMILGIANVALVLPLAFILIPRFQIIGLILALIISVSPSVVIGSWWIKKLYNISISWNQAWRILACSFVTGALTFTIVGYFALSNLLELTIGLLVFSFSFIILAPLMGVINLNDISNLRAVFSETGRLSTLLEIPLRLSSKICKIMVVKKERGQIKNDVRV